MIRKTIREATINREIVPVLHGLGLQEQGRPAAAGRRVRLPAQPARPRRASPATTTTKAPRSRWPAIPDAPLVAMAFKIVDESFGQLTYTRVYQGTLTQGRPIPQRPHRHARSASAASSGCTPTTARTSTMPARRHRRPGRRRLRQRRHVLRRANSTTRSKASSWPSR